MVNIRTRPDSGPDGVEFIFDDTVDYSSRKFRGQANPNNLTTRRWREPILSAAEVADALRVSKGPGPEAAAAKDTIVRSYHRLVLAEAKDFYDGVNNDDVLAVGMMALVEAIDRFDPRSNNGLAAYVIAIVRGRLQTAAKAIKRNGFAGETRLQRLVHGDHDATPERASEVMGGRPVDADELEAATAQAIGMCSEVIAYDTREPAFENEYDEESKPGIIAIAPLSPLQRIHKHHSELVEWYAEDTDRRARKRLKEIGPRAYALELVARDKARIAARAEPTQYLYRTDTPLYVRAGIASQIGRPTPHNSPRRYADRSFSSGPHSVNGLLKKKHSNKRRPRIRVWRCNEPAALAA